MASVPCSIHPEFSSCSAARSRPSSTTSASSELSSAGTPRTPFLGPSRTPVWLRRSSTAATMVGMGAGGGGGARSKPTNDCCVPAQINLQFISTLSAAHHQFSKQVMFSGKNLNFNVSPLVLSPMVNERASIKWSRPLSATDSSEIASEGSAPSSTNSMDVTSERKNVDSLNTERARSDNQLSSSDVQPTVRTTDKTVPEAQDGTIKRTPLTAREKLRAARVLSKYTEPRPSRSELGSRVLDAIRETDKGKKRSGLPEAPSNLFDDSKRGLPKQGFTFNFPGGNDILIIAFSFVFISTIMFATTYIVWKVGAIHFNEY